MAEPPVGTANESPLRIRLLGQFSVWLDGRPIPDERWSSRRARSLVKLLALAPGFRLHRDQVIEALWPETGLASAANSFHQALHITRQALGPACLRLEEGILSLTGPEGQAPWVDAARFTSAAKAARDPETCQAALDLYPGDLLPDDRYEEWTLQPRQALRQQYLDLLLDLARALAERRDYPPAIAALTRLLVADPASEEAHTALMRTYALSGQRQAALRQFQTLREALRAELDAKPGGAALQLYEAIRSGAFPPGESRPPEPGGPRHNLPAQLTSFIGRADQLAQVAALVRDHRLVTLIGAGGVGKTRLALQAAGQFLDHFPHGVWLVALAPLADPDLLPRLIANAIDLPAQPNQDQPEFLVEQLKHRRLLLVLDNCEHIIQGTAGLAARLLAGCPDLHILATSREILGLPGEATFYCPSLTLPVDDSLPALAQSEAVRLFAERVRASQPAFRLDEASAAPVAHICRRLDGIPLAIEMAAALARALSITQIAARLEDAFRLLTGGSRSALPRHQTLRACIDWSYDLLAPEERTLLMRLAVFAGGWTLEAAEQVCADPPYLETGNILALLGRLVDKSLVQFDLSSPGEPRYHMLETIRQYALQRLVESGAEAALRERHLDAFLALARRAEPHLRARDMKNWLDRLERELDNLRAALDGSLQGSLTKGLELATALFWLWWVRNHITEGGAWLDRLLQAQTDRQGGRELDLPGQVARGRAMNVLSCLIQYAGNSQISLRTALPKTALDQESLAIFTGLGEAYRLDYTRSRVNQALESGDIKTILECREAFLALNSPFWVAECDLFLSNIYEDADLEKASFFVHENLAIREEIGDPDGEGNAYKSLGMIEYIKGNLDRAIELFSRAHRCMNQVGNKRYAEISRLWLFWCYLAGGNYEEASRQMELMQTWAREMNHRPYLVDSIIGKAHTAWANGDYEQTARDCDEVSRIELDQCSHDLYISWICYLRGRIAYSQGEIALAFSWFKRIPQRFETENRHIIQMMAAVALKRGQAQRAATLLGARDPLGMGPLLYDSFLERSEYNQALADARAALGEQAFSAAWEAGRAMTLEQAIQYAREGMDEPG